MREDPSPASADFRALGICPTTPLRDRTCRQQIDEYISRFRQGLPNSFFFPSNTTRDLATALKPGKRILYLIQCAFNDVQSAVVDETCLRSQAVKKLPDLIADNMGGLIRDLYEQVGARDFLVVLPGFSYGARWIDNNLIQNCDDSIVNWSAKFGSSHGDVDIETVDWYPPIVKLLDHPEDPGWSQWYSAVPIIKDATCLKGSPDLEPSKVTICDNPGQYVYYDGHFSTATHRYLADQMLPQAWKLVRRDLPTSTSSTMETSSAEATSSPKATSSTFGGLTQIVPTQTFSTEPSETAIESAATTAGSAAVSPTVTGGGLTLITARPSRDPQPLSSSGRRDRLLTVWGLLVAIVQLICILVI